MKNQIKFSLLLLAGWIAAASAMAAPELVSGFIKREVFLGVEGTSVTDLTGSLSFASGQPDAVTLQASFEAPRRSGENYGQRLSGMLIPPSTGSYVFFIASDHDSELWLSLDTTPENKQLIGSVSGRTRSQEWNKFPFSQNNFGAPVYLVAGQSYYIEALMIAGSGQDNLAVGWVLPDQYVDPSDTVGGLANVAVIAGTFLGGTVDRSKSHVTVLTQPVAQKSFAGSEALFSVKAQGSSDLGTQLLYQWRRNDVEISGATSAAYQTPELTPADDGARYSCVVGVPGASVVSASAVLTVRDPQTPRLQIAPALPSGITVWWETSDLGFGLVSSGVLGGAGPWAAASDRPSYEGGTARVTLPADDPERFLRLNHETVVPESLFPATAAPGADSASPGYELGTVFQATTPGLVRAIRLYSLPGEVGTRVGRIWRNGDGAVVVGPLDLPCLGVEGWVDYELPQALAIDPDTAYTVSVSTAQDPSRVFPASANFVPGAGGNDRSLKFPAAAGVFGADPGARPTSTANSSFYFRDVVFVPGEIPPENLIPWALNQPVRFSRGGDQLDRELGTVFRSSVSGDITAIRVFGTKPEGGDHTATIWRNLDGALIGGPYLLNYGCFGQLCDDEWVVYNLDEVLPIDADTDYTVSVSTGRDSNRAYPFIGQVFGVGGDNGKHLSFPAAAGVMGEPGGLPMDVDSATPSYLRDIVLVPTGSSEGESLTGNGAVYAAKAGAPQELGTIFQASVAGTVTGIRVYALNVESGKHLARIWRNNNNTLMGGPYELSYGGSTGWKIFTLPAPLSIDPNTPYTVSVSTGEDAGKAYPYVPDGFVGADSNTKHLTYPALAGVVGSALGVRPTEAPTGNSYLRDIVFQPVAGNARATVGNTTDAAEADVITNPGENGSGAYINGNQFTVTADVTFTSIKAKIGNIPGEYKCAIYSDAGGLGDHLLAATQPRSNPTTGWNEFPLIAPLKVKAGELIWLVIWSDDPNATVYFSKGPGRLRWGHFPYAAEWPDPIVMEPAGNDSAAYCIYAEGTFDAPKPRATIGNTTDASEADVITNPGDNGSGAYINGNQYAATANVTLTSIKAKIGNIPGEYKCAIYSDAGGLGDHLLAAGVPRTNPTTGWNEFPLSAPLQVKAGDLIWLVIWSNDSNATVYYSVGPGRLRWGHVPYAPDWPDPIVMESGGNDNAAYCIYAEGTFDE